MNGYLLFRIILRIILFSLIVAVLASIGASMYKFTKDAEEFEKYVAENIGFDYRGKYRLKFIESIGKVKVYKFTWIDKNGTIRNNTICWDSLRKELFVCNYASGGEEQ